MPPELAAELFWPFEVLHQGFSIINLKKLIDSVRYKTLKGQIHHNIKALPQILPTKKAPFHSETGPNLLNQGRIKSSLSPSPYPPNVCRRWCCNDRSFFGYGLRCLLQRLRAFLCRLF